MAIAVRAVSSGTGTGASVATTRPTGTVTGDVLILFVTVYQSDKFSGTSNAISGWTRRREQFLAYDATNTDNMNAYMECFSRTADLTATDQPDASLGLDPSWAGIAWTMLALSGADTAGTPVSSGDLGSNTTSHVAPSITSTVDGSILLAAASCVPPAGAARSYTVASGMTEQSDLQSGSYPALSVDSLILGTAGSTGAKTLTASGSGATEPWGAISIAWPPAADPVLTSPWILYPDRRSTVQGWFKRLALPSWFDARLVESIPAGTFTTLAGAATASGGSTTMTGAATFTTLAGTGTASGGPSTFTGQATFTTVKATATAAGGSSAFSGAATFATNQAAATAAGGSSTFTGAAVFTTTVGTATAAGGVSTFTGDPVEPPDEAPVGGGSPGPMFQTPNYAAIAKLDDDLLLL